MVSIAVATPYQSTAPVEVAVNEHLEELLDMFETKLGFPFEKMKNYEYDEEDQSLDITHKSGEEYFFTDEEADEILDMIYEIEDLKREAESDW